MKISIIIPIFNASEYLKNCIDSIIEQDYDNFEILLIDDKSTDNSLEICKEYESSYVNIRVLQNSTNSLAGYTRNRGLIESSGDYVWFVDADDWIEKESILKLVKSINSNDLPEIIQFGYKEYSSESDSNTLEFIPNKIPVSTNFFEEYLKLGGGFVVMPFAYLFQRTYLIDNSFFFPEGIYFEDLLFTGKVLSECQNLQVVPKLFYNYYRATHNSMTQTHSIKKIKDILYIYDNLSCIMSGEKTLHHLHSLLTIRFLVLGLSRCFQMLEEIEQRKIMDVELGNELLSYLNNPNMDLEYFDQIISYVEGFNHVPMEMKKVYLFNLNYLKKKSSLILGQ